MSSREWVPQSLFSYIGLSAILWGGKELIENWEMECEELAGRI